MHWPEKFKKSWIHKEPAIDIKLSVNTLSEALAEIVSPDYEWPKNPDGWQLEFILAPTGELIMDFLEPISAVFWSEENEELTLPHKPDGSGITPRDLKTAGIPFMS